MLIAFSEGAVNFSGRAVSHQVSARMDSGEVVGCALENVDLAIEAAELFVVDGELCVLGGGQWCVVVERSGDGLETLRVVVDDGGEFGVCGG